MRFYEIVAILQETSLQAVKLAREDLKNSLTSMNAVILKDESWGLRQFAYPINRHKSGHYIMLCVEALPEIIIELEKNYRIKENVIRFMTLRIKKVIPGPSLMMQSQLGYNDAAPKVVAPQPQTELKEAESK